LYFYGHRIGGADRDTGGTVVAFLSEAITQRVEAKFADCIAFSAIITVFHDTLNADYSETTK
jgi:hypothetical protein